MYQIIVPISKARSVLTKLASTVAKDSEGEIILTKAGEPVAGIVSYEDLRIIQNYKLKRRKNLKISDVLNSLYSKKTDLSFDTEDELASWYNENKI